MLLFRLETTSLVQSAGKLLVLLECFWNVVESQKEMLWYLIKLVFLVGVAFLWQNPAL